MSSLKTVYCRNFSPPPIQIPYLVIWFSHIKSWPHSTEALSTGEP